MARNGRLEGKVAIITGATGGIGEATAARFLAEGASVMLVGRSKEKLSATVARLGETDALSRFQAEAADEQAIEAAVTATVETFGGLDIMFANAGMEGAIKPWESLSVEEFESVMRTNVTGVWLAVKHSIEAMKSRGGGSIIATSSIAGVVGFPNFSAYIASKHAVVGLIKTAGAELAPLGIRANAINPGPIDNRMMESVAEQLAADDPASARAMMEENTPLGRYGTNDEVANLALYLASDESSYTTGAVHLIDGGYTAL